MTADRAAAYTRATRQLTAVAGIKLQPVEIEALREVADVCVFAQPGDVDEADSALAIASGLLASLVDAGRWAQAKAACLLYDLEASAGLHATVAAGLPEVGGEGPREREVTRP